MKKDFTSNYPALQYTDQRYTKKMKVEFPVLEHRDKVLLILYAKFMRYRLHLGVFDGKKKALLINGIDEPGFIQKHKDVLLIKFKDHTERIDPVLILDSLAKRLKADFSLELKKAYYDAACCNL